VYTGEKYEYKSNDNVVFTTKTEAKCEGVYRLNIFDIPKISIDGERDILSYVPAMYLTLKMVLLQLSMSKNKLATTLKKLLVHMIAKVILHSLLLFTEKRTTIQKV